MLGSSPFRLELTDHTQEACVNIGHRSNALRPTYAPNVGHSMCVLNNPSAFYSSQHLRI